MKPLPCHRRFARVVARHQGERGLTLIELLLSLAILAVLTAFLVGGLSMGRRAFAADHANSVENESPAAIQTVADLIGSALPIRLDRSAQRGGVAFEGRDEVLSFVGLSEGRSLPGGPYRILLRRSGHDVVVHFALLNEMRSQEGLTQASTRAEVLSGVREIRLRYFGAMDAHAEPAWHAEWRHAERLPSLVSVRIEFEDERRNEPATIIALRQG